MEPICTIVMPLYNKEKYIFEAVNSVLLQQSQYSIQLIIADDCSTDSGLSIAHDLEAQNPDIIKVLESDKNQGLLSNDIRVFENMKSDYFCVLDPDDYWIDNSFLNKAISYLEEHPDYVCYSSNTIISEEGKPERPFINISTPEYTTSSINDYFVGKALVTHTTASVYRNVIYKNGVPDIIRSAVGTISEASYRGDHDRFIIHLKYGKAYFKNEFVGVYRINNTGIWTSSTQLHRDLLDAQARFDYSAFYDNMYESEFRELALPYYKRILSEQKRMEQNGIPIPVNDQKLLNSVKWNIEINNNMNTNNNLIAQLNSQITKNTSIQQELLWATIFHDTVKGSKWFPENLSLSPGRLAPGYPGLYAMYRILNDVQPTSLLELGLGQSTTIISHYTNYMNDTEKKHVRHQVVEHDASWIDFYKKEHTLPHSSIVQLEMFEAPIDIGEEKPALVNMYKGFPDAFDGQKFDFIFIDAPIGSDEYSRIDIMNILPDCLMDDFVIIMDDYERIGEQRSVSLIELTLQENHIPYHKGIYSGEKATAVIVSENLKFLTTL